MESSLQRNSLWYVQKTNHVTHKAVISGFETDFLPNNPVRYTAMPNAINNEGIWGAAGLMPIM